MATTSTPVKTQGTALLAHTQQASAAVTVGSAVDVSGKFSARIFVKMGRTVGTALTNECGFRLEASAKSSGNDEWFPLQIWNSSTGKTACNASTVNDASFNAADTSFTITSGTGISAGDYMYLRETGTPANSEWVRISAVSGTTITLEEGVTRNHTNGITTTDLAEYWTYEVDCSSIGRLRLVVDSASANSGAAAATGQTVDVIAWIVTMDSVSSA